MNFKFLSYFVYFLELCPKRIHLSLLYFTCAWAWWVFVNTHGNMELILLRWFLLLEYHECGLMLKSDEFISLREKENMYICASLYTPSQEKNATVYVTHVITCLFGWCIDLLDILFFWVSWTLIIDVDAECIV